MSIYDWLLKYCLLVPNEVDILSSVRFWSEKTSLTFKSKPSHLLDYWSNNTNDSTLDVSEIIVTQSKLSHEYMVYYGVCMWSK